MASDADLISGIALTEGGDLFPARRSEGIEAQYAPEREAGSDLQRVGSVDFSDETLLTLVCAKNEQALDVLFNRHSRLVYSIALRILRDAGEAEEVVQETFLYVFRKAVTFEPSRGSAKVWLVQVAYSRSLDRKAHLTRRGFYLHTGLDADELDATIAGPENMEEEAAARLDFGKLVRALDELTEIQRKTLHLFYFEQLELRDISERLHEPLGNVRHHFYRGLERLRKSAIAEGLRDHHHAKH